MIDPGSTLRFKDQVRTTHGHFPVHEIQFSKFRERTSLRLGKMKTLLKGVEDTRIMQVIKIHEYIALELVQANSQTYVLFMDRESGDLKASFQYQREIKSGFIYLCDQSDSDAEEEDFRPEEPHEKMQVDQTGATSDLLNMRDETPEPHGQPGNPAAPDYPFKVKKKSAKVKSQLSGLLSIVQHGLQQYVSHLTINGDRLQSFVFPLNRADHHNLTPADSLKLVDLHSRTMFGITQDTQIFQVKQLEYKNDHHSLLNISSFDFLSQYKCRATEITPLNCYNNVLVALQPSKRYLIYDYMQGQVVKEIQALRGSMFSSIVCPRVLKFDMLTNPDIVIFNQSIIRRVDILTFEIKKNIDLSRLKLPVQSTTNVYP